LRPEAFLRGTLERCSAALQLDFTALQIANEGSTSLAWMMLMDVDKAIAQVSAAGIELTDRRRNDTNDGWILRFANGTILTLLDSGKVDAQGKNVDSVARILDLPASPNGA